MRDEQQNSTTNLETVPRITPVVVAADVVSGDGWGDSDSCVDDLPSPSRAMEATPEADAHTNGTVQHIFFRNEIECFFG